MKTIFGVTFILMVVLFNNQASAQSIPTYQIPSYNVPVVGAADFREGSATVRTEMTKQKRQVNVVVTADPGKSRSSATVWVYSIDLTTILGPFNINFNEVLTVDIDQRDWGVLVESQEKVIVGVWFTGEKSSIPTTARL
jgi:hypothetical protein